MGQIRSCMCPAPGPHIYVAIYLSKEACLLWVCKSPLPSSGLCPAMPTAGHMLQHHPLSVAPPVPSQALRTGQSQEEGWPSGPWPHTAPSFCQTYRAESPVPPSPALRPGAAEGRTSREGHLVLGVQCVPTAKRGMWGSFPGRTVASRWHCPLLPHTPQRQAGPASFPRGEKWHFFPQSGAWVDDPMHQ